MQDAFEAWYKKYNPNLDPEHDMNYSELWDCWSAACKRASEIDEALSEMAQIAQDDGWYDDSIGVIGVEEVEEHDDGSVTYTFHFDDKTKKQLAKLGAEFVLYCAAYEWDIQDALDSLNKGE